jgi:hypothetical protein
MVGGVFISTALMIILSELATVWGPAAKLARFGIAESHLHSIFLFVFLGFLLNSIFVSSDGSTEAAKLAGLTTFQTKKGWSTFSQVVGGVFWGLAFFHGILMFVVHKVDDSHQPAADVIRQERTQLPKSDTSPLPVFLSVVGCIALVSTLVNNVFAFIKNCEQVADKDANGFSVFCFLIAIGVGAILGPLGVLFTELTSFWPHSFGKFCVCQARFHLGMFYLIFGLFMLGSIEWFGMIPYQYPVKEGWAWFGRVNGLVLIALALCSWLYAACHPTEISTQPAGHYHVHPPSHEDHDSGAVAAAKQPAAAETKDDTVADKV